MPKYAAQIALAQKAAKLAEANKATARIPDDPPEIANEPVPAGERRKRAHGARAPPDVRLLSKHEVLDLVGKSYPTLWAWMVAGRFPKPVVVGNENRWFASEVAEWVRSPPRRRLKGDA